MADICPMMSNGNAIVECTPHCAWFDTELNECAISRINANTKYLSSLEHLSNSIDALDNNLTDTIEKSTMILTSAVEIND